VAGRYGIDAQHRARRRHQPQITSAQDRSRLKKWCRISTCPRAWHHPAHRRRVRTKPGSKRDFEYLIRMWETVRDMT